MILVAARGQRPRRQVVEVAQAAVGAVATAVAAAIIVVEVRAAAALPVVIQVAAAAAAAAAVAAAVAVAAAAAAVPVAARTAVPTVVVAEAAVVAINTLRPRQNGRHFPDDIFKRILLNENAWISIKISLKFVPINNIPASVHIMTRRQAIIWTNDG